MILTFNSALLLGLQLHWMGDCGRDDFSVQRAARELAAGRYTGFFAFPVAYTLLKEIDWAKYDITRMRVWASTDAAHMAIQRVFVQHGRAFKSLGLPLRGSIYLDAQGSSEVGTPSVIRYLSAYTRRFDRRIGPPGSSPFGPEIRITGSSGGVVRQGEAGRLEVPGRTLFAGYWNNDALTRQAMHGDWFFTGDIVRQERDGHLIQLDREVDVIHSAGAFRPGRPQSHSTGASAGGTLSGARTGEHGMSILVSILLASLLIAVEQQPDFSGTWIGISPPEAAGEAQVVKQDSETLTVGHDSEAGPHSHVFTHKLDGTETRRVLKSHGEDIVTLGTASWDGNRLVIQERTTYPDGRKLTRRSVWSLNERRELEIEMIEQVEGKPQVTVKAVYRKKG